MILPTILEILKEGLQKSDVRFSLDYQLRRINPNRVASIVTNIHLRIIDNCYSKNRKI